MFIKHNNLCLPAQKVLIDERYSDMLEEYIEHRDIHPKIKAANLA